MKTTMQRRHAMGTLAGCGVGLLAVPALGTWPGTAVASTPAQADVWPAWSVFKNQFVSADGRVVDRANSRRHTVSEGQAYALFFALVANDRAGFDLLLRWTENNLCQGDMSAHLPAWQWGRRDDGHWGVIDPNSASDADLWLAYTLGQAGRLWHTPRFTTLGQQISERVLREETAALPSLGPTLLPGPQGFAIAPGRWRLNASYNPPQVLQWLAGFAISADQAASWAQLAQSALQTTLASAPKGFAADWVVFDGEQGFLPDSQGPEAARGGYNAIRVYLWVGTLHPDAPHRTRLLQALQAMAAWVGASGQVPETVDSLTGQTTQTGPAGFAAALLPFLQAQGDLASVALLRQRLHSQPLRADAYFEQALGLFGLGWMDGHYRYTADGALQPRWSAA